MCYEKQGKLGKRDATWYFPISVVPYLASPLRVLQYHTISTFLHRKTKGGNCFSCEAQEPIVQCCIQIVSHKIARKWRHHTVDCSRNLNGFVSSGLCKLIDSCCIICIIVETCCEIGCLVFPYKYFVVMLEKHEVCSFGCVIKSRGFSIKEQIVTIILSWEKRTKGN